MLCPLTVLVDDVLEMLSIPQVIANKMLEQPNESKEFLHTALVNKNEELELLNAKLVVANVYWMW